MKWLSVKKYRHVEDERKLFIRSFRKEFNQEFFQIGFFCQTQKIYLEVGTHEEIECKSWKVTHFCIPDPIEIEEE